MILYLLLCINQKNVVYSKCNLLKYTIIITCFQGIIDVNPLLVNAVLILHVCPTMEILFVNVILGLRAMALFVMVKFSSVFFF